MDYPKELKEAEFAAITKKRVKNRQDIAKPKVGVALSGGGVRSSTQSLGAFQALQEQNLDKEIDYLSTVSGGGYFGTFWSRCWMENDTNLKMDDRKIKYLRNSGNYIAPTGSGDLFKSFAQYITNWFSFYLVIFSFVFMFAMITRFLPYFSQVHLVGGIALSVYGIIPIAAILSLLVIGVIKLFTSCKLINAMTYSLYALCGGLCLFAIDSIGFNIYKNFTVTEVGGISSTVTLLLYLLSLGKDFIGRVKSLRIFTVIIKYSFFSIVLTVLLSSIFAFSHIVTWEMGTYQNFTFDLSSYTVPIIFGLVVLFNIVIGGIKNLLNKLSMHGIFHDKLVRGFMGAAVPNRLSKGVMYSTSLEEDDIPEDEYRPYENGGPLHIINMTLNETIDGRSNLYQLNRKGCNFAVIPTIGKSIGVRHHCIVNDDFDMPTKHKTYTPINVPNKSYQVWGNKGFIPEPMTIGKYMAISAAAMSTGMGKLTNIFHSLMFGLFGVRFGYWWDSGVDKGDSKFPFFINQRMLTRELLAAYRGTASRHWYLSDGGHFENLALYELLRRKLKFMISFDHGQCPNYDFESLADLTRTVRADFGTSLRMLTSNELDDMVHHDVRHLFGTKNDMKRNGGSQFDGIDFSGYLTKQGAGVFANAYATLIEVTYANGDIGHILYIVPTLLGNEPIDVVSYYMRNPDFPQQSTSDQFFDEEQWESYRKLMNHIVTKLFESNQINTPQQWMRKGEIKLN